MEAYDENSNHYYGNHTYEQNQSSNKNLSSRERGGLIPVTAHIINKAEVTKEETVEYQGVTISDITAIGYIVDYKESEANIRIIIYDYTGLIDVNFFSKQEGQDSIGLNRFKYDGSRKPVQVFCTIKVYKNEKSIQGAKLVSTDSNYVLFHRANVIHSWLYLTGKLQEIKDNNNNNTNQEVRIFSNNNAHFQKTNINKSKNDEEEACKILDNYAKKEKKNVINENKIKELFNAFGSKSKEIINILIDNNKIINRNDGSFEII